MSVIKDGIGDRDIPGATASQLVEVREPISKSSRTQKRSRLLISVQTVCAELGDACATIVESKDL